MGHPPNHAQAMQVMWQALKRYRWRFVLPAFAISAAVIVVSFFLPRKYKAEAIFDRRTDLVMSEIIARGAPRTLENSGRSLTQEVAGRPAIDQLIQTLAQDPKIAPLLGNSPADRQALRHKLEHTVNVYHDISSPELDRVRISYEGDNARLAQAVVNTLVRNYIAATRAQITDRLKQSAAFFQNQVTQSRTAVEGLENKALAYQIDHAQLLPDSPNSVQVQLSVAQAQLADIQQKKEAAALHVQALQKNLDDTPAQQPSVITARNPALTELLQKRQQLTAKLVDDLNVLKMTDDHPDVIALRQSLAELNDRIAHTPAEVVTQRQVSANPRRAQVKLMLADAQTQVEALNHQIAAVQQRIAALNGQSDKLFPVRSAYRRLSGQIDTGKQQVSFWEDNLRRVQMALAAEDGNRGVQLAFIKPADALDTPVSPNIAQVLMAALLLGLVAGGVNVFVAHRNDESFHDAGGLAQALSVPLFGSVGEVITRRQRRLRTFTNSVLFTTGAAAMAAILLALGATLYLNLDRPEQFAQLRRNPAAYLHDRLAPAASRPTKALE